ncbi:hypothetical protein D3C84_981110 [compost metagenome]
MVDKLLDDGTDGVVLLDLIDLAIHNIHCFHDIAPLSSRASYNVIIIDMKRKVL